MTVATAWDDEPTPCTNTTAFNVPTFSFVRLVIDMDNVCGLLDRLEEATAATGATAPSFGSRYTRIADCAVPKPSPDSDNVVFKEFSGARDPMS